MKFLVIAALLSTLFTFSSRAHSAIDYAVGGRIICALEDDGSPNCSTASGFSRLQPPLNAPALTTITAGDVHVCGITDSGSAYCWGDNDFGQLDAPENEQFIGISASINRTCGVTADNRALCWGLDNHGETQPPAGSAFLQVSNEPTTSCGLTIEGGVECWGQFDFAPYLDSGEVFTKLASRTDNLCGLTDSGNIRCRFSLTAPVGSDMIDLATTRNLICGLHATGDIQCTTNLGGGDWRPHLARRVAQINSGPDVVALYGSPDINVKLCYSTVDGGFGCIIRENRGEPLLPGDGFNELRAPQNLSADVFSESTVELLWDIPIESVARSAVAGADIYRDGELLDTTPNGASYIDSTLTPGIDYTYEVAFFNTEGDRGPRSASITVNSSQDSSDMDTGYAPVSRPLAPSGLFVVPYSGVDIELFWDRPDPSLLPPDFNGYEIRRNHEFYAFTRGVSFYDNAVESGKHYHYDVVAVKRDGTILGFSGVDVTTPGD